MMFVSWPAKIAASKDVRHQYVHAIDIVPTIYDLLGIESPDVINGYVQSPIEGESFAAALTDASVPGKETQFYTMLGQRSIYHQGWLACTVHPPLAGWGNFEKDEWELYNLETDRAQSHDVAADEPDRLELLKSLWWYYAGIYNGLPLDDRSALEQVLADRPRPAPPRDQYVFYPNCSDVPEEAGPMIPGRSYTIAAGVDVDSADAQGVIWAAGGVAGGHALYVKDHRLRYTFNWVGSFLQDVVADVDLTPGHHVLTADFAASGPSQDPDHPGTAGTLTLYVDDDEVGSGELITQPGYFCITGDGISVGKDSASAVSPQYTAPNPFTGGSIEKVVVDLSGDRFVDHEAQVIGWFMKD
jgi:arylsulfatase